MKSILEKLWYGNIFPTEEYDNNRAETKELLELAVQNYQKLCKTISKEEKETLDIYGENLDELHNATERKLFTYAFELGGRFMLETLMGSENR